jgi:hypothetical protein
VIHPEDRNAVIAVAVQMWCARLQYGSEGRQPNGSPKHGYSPDIELCVGEAATLVRRVNEHMNPHERRPSAAAVERERRRRGVAVELEWVGGVIPP